MGNLRQLIGRFRRDERGNFAIIFGLIAIVLTAMAGATVDFTSMQQARTRAQVALDAAALALQPSIYTTSATTIGTEAKALLLNRLADAKTTWVDCDTNHNTAPCASMPTPVIDTVKGQLTLQATVKVPMNFVSMVGVPTLTAVIQSVATRQKLAIEVAMVLDNSGSMSTTMTGGNTRMYNLKASANCAVNILYYGVATCSASTSGLTANTDTKMAVVPFTSAVNVGTSHANDFWIDRTGTNNISDNNFDTDDNDANNASSPFSGPVDRIGLFSNMKYNGTALSWGGCVEARYNNGGSKQYDTDDTTPDASQPDTLFTPYFAPDEPGNPNTAGHSETSNGDTFYNSYLADDPAACKPALGNCTIVNSIANYRTSVTTTAVTQQTVTVRSRSTGAITSGPTTTTTTSTTGPSTTTASPTPPTSTAKTFVSTAGVTTTGATVCTCANDTTTTSSPVYNNGTTATNTSVSGPTTTTSSTFTRTTTTVTTVTTTTQTTPQTQVITQSCTQHYYASGLDNRELQERMCKYGTASSQVTLSNAPSQGSVYGPNGDCPTNPITPLTVTPATVTAAVNAMAPQGATNIAEGAGWGFRVLSPTEPFTQGAAYGQATSKIMIIMTDGENTRYPAGNMNDAQYYSPYGFPWNSNGRLGSPTTDAHTLEQRVNARLSTICTNAKAAGITVYTIGLATGSTDYPSENTTLLTNCASESDYAFFPNSASDLQNAFVSIANQLAALRLAK